MKMTGNRKAIAISLLIHAGLLMVLCFWYLPVPGTGRMLGAGRDAPSAEAIVDGGSKVSQEVSRGIERAPAISGQRARQPSKALVEASNTEVSEADVSNAQIAKSVESQIQAVEKLSDERKLTELEKNLRRLQAVAGEQSVQQVSSTIAESLGLDVNQYASKQASDEGDFDTNTAQMSDVIRATDDTGTLRFEIVMVDAQGHQMSVPVDAAQGQQLHETFELMKRYPLARGVYQSVVMPMMQKMLEGERDIRREQPTVIMPAESTSD